MVTSMHRPTSRLPGRQRGAALIISLLILLVMTIIGVTAMQTNILEEKMAGNDRDIALSLQAAEAALRAAEAEIETIVSPAAAFDGNTAGYYPSGSYPDVFDEDTWAVGSSIGYGGEFPHVTSQPRYIIELMGEIGTSTNDVNLGGYGETSGLGTVNSFRITARGTGGSDNTATFLQAYYAKRF